MLSIFLNLLASKEAILLVPYFVSVLTAKITLILALKLPT